MIPGNIQFETDITHLSNFHTNAKAKYFLEISSREDISSIYESISWCKSQKLPYILITGGTNSLFAFDIYPGLVIHISLLGWSYDEYSHILSCSAGDKIWDIAYSLEYDYGQNIWHRFIGLPGSIAGAIYGNAGCFGLETASNFLDVNLVNLESGELMRFQKSDMDFSYRNSRLKQEKKYCIISARFDLSYKIEKYSSDIDNIAFRENIQPKGNSCGSFFKNPSKEQSAGFLIEQVGLKGYSLGGAYFSEKHANFLMAHENSNYHDLLDLISLAQERVQNQFGIHLEPEVQIVSIS